MADVEGLQHCPTCETGIQRTGCGVPYCPNLDCAAQKGAHDWELVPILLHIAATERLGQTVGLVPQVPAPAARLEPKTPEEVKRSNTRGSAEVLARALRRNKY